MWCDVVVLVADHVHLEADGFGFALRGRSEDISVHNIDASMVAGLHGGSGCRDGKGCRHRSRGVCVKVNMDSGSNPLRRPIDQLFVSSFGLLSVLDKHLAGEYL